MSLSHPARHLRLASAAMLAVCLGSSAAAFAQEKPVSLADIARKESERRKAVKVPSQVFTDKDVRASIPRPAPPAPAPASEAQKPETPEIPPAKAAAKPGEEKDEAWWRERVGIVREEIRRNELFAEALQSRINALATDFANRDDPFQRLKVGEDRQKAMVELGRVRADIETSRKQLADIEEEARRAGIPPGWIR